jgi:hypothetical protein
MVHYCAHVGPSHCEQQPNKLCCFRDVLPGRYLNGQEVYRFNLPVPNHAAVDAATEYSQKPPDIYGRPFDKEYGLVTPLPPTALREGENTLAVEVHNADHVQTDLKCVSIAVLAVC